jgi:hypothetical protein
MTRAPDGKQVPAEAFFDINLSVAPSRGAAPSIAVQARYHFNLTDGETMIRDEEGIVACSLQAAVVSAPEAIEELRAHDPAHANEWQG